MKKAIIIFFLVAGVIAVVSCKKNTDSTQTVTAVYLDLPAKVYPYYTNTGTFFGQAYTDSVNKVTTLGRVLFYDSHLSVNNAVSCGSCHKQQFAFADNAAFSAGFEFRPTKRNSPPIQDIDPGMLIKTNAIPLSSNDFVLFWDGREDNIQSLISRPISNHVEMGISDLSTLPAKLATLDYYKSLFTNAYGSDEITVDKISQAVALFISSINSNNSRFSKAFVPATDSFGHNIPALGISSLTSQEQEGYTLFMTKYNCQNCHHINNNNYSTEMLFVDNGLDATYSDLGRGAITHQPSDNGTFKVPSLHNVAVTAPYMHDGRFKTLEEVLDHYSHGINNSPNLSPFLKDTASAQAMQLNISDHEKQAIIAFLNTFTDYQMISDPKFSNPFKVK